jgi:hypothetical protein
VYFTQNKDKDRVKKRMSSIDLEISDLSLVMEDPRIPKTLSSNGSERLLMFPLACLNLRMYMIAQET